MKFGLSQQLNKRLDCNNRDGEVLELAFKCSFTENGGDPKSLLVLAFDIKFEESEYDVP